jgi:chromosome condensin MukBEF ATPase and DNA-binding subunit MukB
LLKEVTDPLYKDDGFSVANLVTREEADQEKKDADIEIENLRQALAEKEQALKEQQTVVAEKEQSGIIISFILPCSPIHRL